MSKENIKELTDIFDEWILFKVKTDRNYKVRKHLDLALLYLLKNSSDNEELQYHVSVKMTPFEFHRAFRQVDIVDGLDSVFWQLLSGSDLFFKAYDLYCKGEKFDEFNCDDSLEL